MERTTAYKTSTIKEIIITGIYVLLNERCLTSLSVDFKQIIIKIKETISVVPVIPTINTSKIPI